MSILFSETSQKKAPKLPKKPLGKAFPHLSIPSHSSSIPSIFSEFPDPPPPPSLFRPTHSLPDPIPKHETIKGNHIIQQFIDSDPLLKSHCDLVPNTNIRLSLSEKHKSSLESALKVEFSLKSVQRIVDSIAKRSQSRQADFLRDFRSLSHHKSGSIDRRTHLSRYKALHTQLISRIHFMLDGFLTLSLKIGGIVRLIESNLDTDLLVRFSTSDIEKHLAGFETTDREYLILEQAIARERRDLTTKQHYGDYGQCFELVQKLFDPLTASYPDTGEIDSLFGHITEQNSDETLQNRLKTVLQRPETAGKVALALAHDSMKDKVKNNKTLFMAAFLMAARYLFSQIYLRKSFHQCNPEFLRRIAEMRKFPPIVFGVNPGFLKPQLMTIPLLNFPAENRYREAIDLFRIAVFQYCPIDFCQIVYKALKLIQRAASMKSWKMQNKTTGKVYAMSEHLLSFDDLFDISLIVWLLAEPGIFQEVVEMFMPYIRGLELTSELEFAFTNVSAFVRHIIDLDFERFMIQARSKSIEAIEVDPLNILNQATF